MKHLRHHLRPFGVAVATLALGAGVAFAGGGVSMPDAASDGLSRAAEAAGKPVPVVARPQAPAIVEQPAEPAEPAMEPAVEPAKDRAADEPCATLPAGEEYETHGAKVCAAARGEIPDGFDSRGEYVRTVARANHGAEVRAEKAANGGVPAVASAAKQKAREKARAAGAPADPGAPAGRGGRP